MNSTRRTFYALVVLLGLTPFGCTSSNLRLKRRFDVHQVGRIETADIRSAVLKQLPLGTSQEEVVRYLREAGMAEGVDYARDYYEVESARLIFCNFQGSSNLFWPDSMIAYFLKLHFDSSRRLSEVEVRQTSTFP